MDDPEKNVGTIHASNPEHSPCFKAPLRDNLEHTAGKTHILKGGRGQRKASKHMLNYTALHLPQLNQLEMLDLQY